MTAFLDEREDFTGQMIRADGVVIDFALMPLSDGATLLTFADVTDAKRAEQALVERNEALVAADRLKTNFIGHISRELRTPLTSIIGFAEMLASPMFGDLNDKQREYLDRHHVVVEDAALPSSTIFSISRRSTRARFS